MTSHARNTIVQKCVTTLVLLAIAVGVPSCAVDIGDGKLHQLTASLTPECGWVEGPTWLVSDCSRLAAPKTDAGTLLAGLSPCNETPAQIAAYEQRAVTAWYRAGTHTEFEEAPSKACR